LFEVGTRRPRGPVPCGQSGPREDRRGSSRRSAALFRPAGFGWGRARFIVAWLFKIGLSLKASAGDKNGRIIFCMTDPLLHKRQKMLANWEKTRENAFAQ
ncbi:MAG: hypothetical protein KBC66_01480, partial [Kiritimatiellae bacterium]|nr:hypothetical protein [Kiritimatiellia bacterium]